MVLEEDMDYDEIYERFDHTEHILSATRVARDWMDDEEAYEEGLAADWPLTSSFSV